jgi:antibiotic biosynthesis monooxygenase (ABM) superfamily enzyme
MSEKPRHLQWARPEDPRPKHRYRDTLLVYGGLAVAVVLFGWLTGGGVVKAVVVAAILFVVASTYSLVHWHELARNVRGRGGRRP